MIYKNLKKNQYKEVELDKVMNCKIYKKLLMINSIFLLLGFVYWKIFIIIVK